MSSPQLPNPDGTATAVDVRRYRSLVERLARRLARRAGPAVPRAATVDDLVGYGHIGLLEAARRYEPGGPATFGTFAFPRIRGAMVDGLRELRSSSAGPGRGAPSRGDGDRPEATEPFDVEGLADSTTPRPDEVAATRQALDRIWEAARSLPDRELHILRAHYGEGVSLDAVGARLGLSRSWASRLHARAIDKLGQLLKDPVHDASPADRFRPSGPRSAP